MDGDKGARQPVTTLAGFSSEDAVATTWASGRSVLEDAEVYWVSSVRPDGRPHVTLQSVAGAYESKYGSHFTSRDGPWFGLGDSIRQSKMVLYRLDPARVLGFAKGKTFSQTR